MIIMIIGITFCAIIIMLPIIFAIADSKRVDKYIKSIKPGDIFVNRLFIVEAPDDPFDEKYNRSDAGCYDESFFTTILDIKKNRKNEIWVKYCYTNSKTDDPKIFTERIDKFLKYRYRLNE